jgi:hypothetical protein
MSKTTKTTRLGRGVALAVALAASVACTGTVYDGDGTCFAPDQCLDRCGGRVVKSGVCGPCAAGTVSAGECRVREADSGGDAVALDRATTPCFRAVRCVSACGGAEVQSGCCPCPAGTFDDLVCRDAGADAGDASADAGDGSSDARAD